MKLVAAAAGAGLVAFVACEVLLPSNPYRYHPLAVLDAMMRQRFTGWLKTLVPGALVGFIVGMVHLTYGRKPIARRPPTALLECASILAAFVVAVGFAIPDVIDALQSVGGDNDLPLDICRRVIVLFIAGLVASFVASRASGLPRIAEQGSSGRNRRSGVLLGSELGGLLTGVFMGCGSVILSSISSEGLYETLFAVVVGGGLAGSVIGVIFGGIRLVYMKKHPSGEMSLVAAAMWPAVLGLLGGVVICFLDGFHIPALLIVAAMPIMLVGLGINFGASAAILWRQRRGRVAPEAERAQAEER